MAAKLVVKLEGLDRVVKELERRGADVGAVLEQITHAGAKPIFDAASPGAPSATEFAQRTTSKSGAKVTVTIGPTRKKMLAVFAEFGTRPHKIVARKAAGLKRGRWALAVPGFGTYRSVKHPGTKRKPFMRPAFVGQQETAQQQVKQKDGTIGA